MLKKIFVLVPFIVVLSSPAHANSVAQSQRMLNQLGYNAGAVDGTYGGKTKRAFEKFCADNGSSYDGKLDANEVADLRSSISARGLNSIAKIAVTDQHRFDNFPGIVNFQLSHSMRKYWFGYTWLTSFDATDDGEADLILWQIPHLLKLKGRPQTKLATQLSLFYRLSRTNRLCMGPAQTPALKTISLNCYLPDFNNTAEGRLEIKRRTVCGLCINCAWGFGDYFMYKYLILLEAGTGIEPVYTDLQSAA